MGVERELEVAVDDSGRRLTELERGGRVEASVVVRGGGGRELRTALGW